MTAPSRRLLVRNTSQVVTCEGRRPFDLGVVEHGSVLIEDGKGAWVGPERRLRSPRRGVPEGHRR